MTLSLTIREQPRESAAALSDKLGVVIAEAQNTLNEMRRILGPDDERDVEQTQPMKPVAACAAGHSKEVER